ncbi:MAG: FAD-binding oxidoreductase [Chloroflexi bacterium]|nr:FAD-binding oxidoreductase [Chloroflexota bacterium]
MSAGAHAGQPGDRHVVVVGAGAVGAATAYYLSRAGTRVTLVEREGIGNGASGWSAGGVNPLHGIPEPLAALAMASYRLHRELWPELARLSSQRLHDTVISMAHVAVDEVAVPGIQALAAGFDAAEGFSARWVDAAELRQREPRLTGAFAGALLSHGNGVVESQGFTLALAEAAQKLGATLVSGDVTGLVQDSRRVAGVQVNGSILACDAVVMAMGPWSGAAEAWFGLPLPISPLKGEIVRMQLAGAPLPFDVVTPEISLFARPGGQVWLASTQQRAGFDREISAWGYQTLYEPAVRLMPEIANATLVRQTACLRPIAPDDLPVVGPVPGWDGAYVATGAGTKGILFAPGMGKAVADLILTGQTGLDIDACSAARFTTAG